MTFNGRDVTIAEKFYGARQKNLYGSRPVLSVAKCRPMIQVSRNYIRYMQIFAGFLGEGSSNGSGVVEDGNFHQLLLAIYSETLDVRWKTVPAQTSGCNRKRSVANSGQTSTSNVQRC